MTPIIAKPSRDRREESGSIMLYALFAVILLSSLAFLTTTLTPNTTSAALDLKRYIESLNTEVGELPDEEPPEIVVDYGSVIDAGFIQAAEAAGNEPDRLHSRLLAVERPLVHSLTRMETNTIS